MQFGDRDLSSAIAMLSRAIEAADAPPAVQWLGARRGRDGVGLAAALDDLVTAYRVAAGVDPAAPELRELALAWAEGAFAALEARGALDPDTGLATREYLATRLRDLARLGEADARQLLVVAPGAEGSRLAMLLRSARVAAEIVGSFTVAETPIGLSEGRVGALVAIDDGFAAGMLGLRRAIARIDAGPERTDRDSGGTTTASRRRDGTSVGRPRAESSPEPLLRMLDLPTDPADVRAFLASL